MDIILLSYNRLEYLVEMVASLEQHTRLPYSLTIVDNASGPQTRQWLRANSGRFHQIVWNERNEHLAGLQRGIAVTSGELFVISDADLVVSEPTEQGCWLTRLTALGERHPDFGLIGVRLDSVSAARNAKLEAAPLIDGELLETPTGVWLNLIRRGALRGPYMSDGITCHALRRAGYRVGIAADIVVTHLGDADPARHPDYLARKQAASGWRTTYPAYGELDASPPPPTLHAIALAAPVLAALEREGVAAQQALELCAPHRVVGAVVPELRAFDARTPTPAAALVLVDPSGEATARAFASSVDLLVVLSATTLPQAPEVWELTDEHCGPHAVALSLAKLASRARWRRRLLYSTVEHRDGWLAVFRAACFGEAPALRVYVFRRVAGSAPAPDAALSAGRPASGSNPFTSAVRVRRRGIGTLVTKLRRLVIAEWRLRRGSGR